MWPFKKQPAGDKTPPTAGTVVFRIVRIAVLVYLGLVAALFVFQKHFIFHPRSAVDHTPARAGLDYEPVTIPTADGERLDAWWIPVDKPRAVILFSHGNAGNMADRTRYAPFFHRHDFSCLFYDYRGYGNSTGSCSETGTYADIEACWRYLTETRDIPAGDIIIYGKSLGGGVATYLAERVTARGLVLDSTFTSIGDLATDIYKIIPGRLLAIISYDTIRRMPHIDMPVLVIHSTDDEIVPFSHGRALYGAATADKRFLEVTGGHNASFAYNGGLYMRTIEDFFCGESAAAADAEP